MPTPPPSTVPDLLLKTALPAIGDLRRWAILRELAGGDQLMVVEIAERIRLPATLVSKHLAVLREAGIVAQARSRLYQIKPQFLADRDQRIVDLGWCLLRMNTA